MDHAHPACDGRRKRRIGILLQAVNRDEATYHVDVDERSPSRRGQSLPTSRVDVTYTDRMTDTAVLVLNYNGREHLLDCFESLADVARAGFDRVQVWLVDNGSSDGSVELAARRYPWVKVLPLAANLGFSVAYNRAVASCDAEWIAFLNNDTRVAPDWLSQLHACRRRHPEAAAVASRIMSWDGARVDFVGADTYFFGHALQRDLGAPATGRTDPERRLLFGCAGSLLMNRAVFEDIGGFDPDYFSFSEDVDLGWRATVLGHSTWFAPEAITYHKLHATWGRQSLVRQRAIIERNALFNVLKNYEGTRYGVLVLSAVALAFLRTWAWTTTLAEADRPRITADGIAHLTALRGFSALASTMQTRRGRLQESRAATDDSILPLFGDLVGAQLPPCPRYGEAFAATIEALGLSHSPPLPSWQRSFNAVAADTAIAFARCCGSVLDEWDAASRFIEIAPDPTWEFVLSQRRSDALARLRDACEQLVAASFSTTAVEALAKTLAAWSEGADHPAVGATSGSSPERNRAGEPRPEHAAISVRGATTTVIVRTHEPGRGLRRAVDSALAQTLPPRAILIVNDGGPDVSEQLPTDAHVAIEVVSLAAPRGRSAAAQVGLEAANTRFVCFLDDDDELLPRHLEVLVAAHQSSGARICYADAECITWTPGDNGSRKIVRREILGGEVVASRLRFENTLPLIAVLFDRELALEVGGFDPAMDYFEDWDLWLRLLTCARSCHVAEITSVYWAQEGGGMGGSHRYPYLAALFDRHKEALSGRDWATFYAEQLEPLRLHASHLADALAATTHALAEAQATVESMTTSKYWRAYQWIRRQLGRR